jgi:hypothetical protein
VVPVVPPDDPALPPLDPEPLLSVEPGVLAAAPSPFAVDDPVAPDVSLPPPHAASSRHNNIAVIFLDESPIMEHAYLQVSSLIDIFDVVMVNSISWRLLETLEEGQGDAGHDSRYNKARHAELC